MKQCNYSAIVGICVLVASCQLTWAAAGKEFKQKQQVDAAEHKTDAAARLILESFFNPSTLLYKNAARHEAGVGALSRTGVEGCGNIAGHTYQYHSSVGDNENDIVIEWTIDGKQKEPTHSEELNKLVIRALERKGWKLKRGSFERALLPMQHHDGYRRCSDKIGSIAVEHCIYNKSGDSWSKFRLQLTQEAFKQHKKNFFSPLLQEASSEDAKARLVQRIGILT